MPTHAQWVFCKRGQSSIWIQSEWAMDAFIDQIVNPDALLGQPECEIIKDQAKTKVGCLQVTLGDRPLRLYIKRFNICSWRHRLGSRFMTSAAVKSMRGAGILADAGIGTPHPIAAVEQRRWGMLTSSFYVSEEVAGGKVSSHYWCDDLQPLTGAAGILRRRAFVRALAELFAKLHAQNIYHNDLKDFNILIAPGDANTTERLVLLDLEGVRRLPRLGQRRRIKNLVQLNRTLGKYWRSSDVLRFLKCYLGPQFLDMREKAKWVRAVVTQSRELDRQKIAL